MAKDMSAEVQAAIIEAIRSGVNTTEQLLDVTRSIAPNHEFVLRELKRQGIIRATVKNDGNGGVVHRYSLPVMAAAASSPAAPKPKVVNNG